MSDSERAVRGAGLIRRLGIVNRGEPAMRALGAVAELNFERRAAGQPTITSVALYTVPDAEAWFVRQADEAIALGPATYTDPNDGRRKSAYLDEERVVSLLVEAAVDAVWVGWGFVAEHASFAARCEEAGIIFVGPTSATIRQVGDKITSKRIAEQAGVPVVPWNGGAVSDPAAASTAAEELGFPVVLKASSGGGGRGIRIVRRPEDLADALVSAQTEAELAFGDPAVFMEEFVPAARHVEVQVIADAEGTTWALGLRDCSVQRRNQKVLEESASTVLDAAREQQIKDAAVRLAKAAHYRSAGTVEFLVAPDGSAFHFMEVNARLQVEHPVTEITTGADLVKLQLLVAEGGTLPGPTPPPARGHAIEARLNAEDPEQSFAPAPGRLSMLRMPAGTGVRVDSGVQEGDAIAPDFDSMIAKVIAYGADRPEALARLRRALADTVVVVDGGTTNRSFLLQLLDNEKVQSGEVDNRWLDRLTEVGEHLPPMDPVALVAAAVEVYDAEHDAVQTAFHTRSQRGRPKDPDEVGHSFALRYRGQAYRLRVLMTAPGRYRVKDPDGHAVDVAVVRLNEYERFLTCADGSRRHVVADSRASGTRVEVDGIAHTVSRDDGGTVRAASPAFVVSYLVEPGQQIQTGDPIAVLESMKMESIITAPYAGTVMALEAPVNAQVDAGNALMRIKPDGAAAQHASSETRVDLASLAAAAVGAQSRAAEVYDALTWFLLGYDLDDATQRALTARQRALGEELAADDPELLEKERRFLGLFADLASLSRPRSEADPEQELSATSPQEYLNAFLQWLDRDRAGLPEAYAERLEHTLEHYGVVGLDHTPAMEAAVPWLFRGTTRVQTMVPAATAILQRRLRCRDVLLPDTETGQTSLRAAYDRLADATVGRYPAIAELARDVRFHYLDEPRSEAAAAEVYAGVELTLDELADQPDEPRRSALIAELVACPQPLRATLLHRWWEVAAQGDAGEATRRALLETHLRRFYRIRDVHELANDTHGNVELCSAVYDYGVKHVAVVVAYLPLDEVAGLAPMLAEHLAERDDDRKVVLDLATWRAGPMADVASLSDQVKTLLTELGGALGRPLWRVDVTVTSTEGAVPQHLRTQHVTFRQSPEGDFFEETVYRNLHPMLAKRLDLWRLSNFDLKRLASPENVYLFRGQAHSNPSDVRLFALAEVRDLVPLRQTSSSGETVTYPSLERVATTALAAMRDALAAMPVKQRPLASRLVLYVRPEWQIPTDAVPALAHSLEALGSGIGLEKVVLRITRTKPTGKRHDSVLHIEGGSGAGVTVRERPVGEAPIRPLTPYRQKVLRAARFGVPYPYEIVRMLAPRPGSAGDFPSGKFVEHDLDEQGQLVPTGDRDLGSNTANIVVGTITNYTDRVPEGMTRVILLGDPTRGLGNLSEPECRRINAGLDLAEELGVPLEWFAVSSGARIAMDSGTENMDWISAVLRRIIEFTQGGGEINVVVTGVNVGAQPYWNAEATMLMHTKGILVMMPNSAMVLTGKQALDFSGGVSAEDNLGIGGFDRIMGVNGQGQYWAATLEEACHTLLRHYDLSYVVTGERFPRRAQTSDPVDRDIRTAPHASIAGLDFTVVGDVFSAEKNPERKRPFDMRSIMRAVTDTDLQPMERWGRWREAETAIVWDSQVGGIPVAMLGMESVTLARRGFVPGDGPTSFTSGTLFPQSSRKMARAINSASGRRPVVMLANLSGFDGSPESMRRWQLEYGAEIGRAVTNFRGPFVFVVVSRYHGGAFVVFSKKLNESVEIAAVEGSYASVIGGAPAAATVFVRDVRQRTEHDPRVVALRERVAAAEATEAAALRAELAELTEAVRSEKLGEVADEFDAVHDINRAQRMGSVDRIIAAKDIRPYVVDALERGMARLA